ncbi:MAG: TIGR03862 family flavoprotein [Pseudomonadota bacterium]
MSSEIAIIGAGPAGLAAAEMLIEAGHVPVIYESKPSPARKFLMAGKSGLNLTMDAPAAAFMDTFRCNALRPALAAFGPRDVQDWARDLGEPLFTGSSGRVFPEAMKGSPLLRKWLARLAAGGAILRRRWAWTGFENDALRFETPDGVELDRPRATVLALGGASWPQLGSDAAWVPWLAAKGVRLAPFKPANMGFEHEWSAHFRDQFAGTPVKGIGLSVGQHRIRGEFVIAGYGVEGSAIYALSARLRDSDAPLVLDLTPDRSEAALVRRLSRPRGKASRSNFLRKSIGLRGVKAGLLRELAPDAPEEPRALAQIIKALPLPLTGPRPIAEAISSAGGVAWDGLDERLMLRALPGVFAAGEMLDWEAPTGGYLLTASIATGRLAGRGAAAWLAQSASRSATA